MIIYAILNSELWSPVIFIEYAIIIISYKWLWGYEKIIFFFDIL